MFWQLGHWWGSAESGPSFCTVAKSAFLFLSDLTWVLSDSESSLQEMFGSAGKE
jgi:hypothetical protein